MRRPCWSALVVLLAGGLALSACGAAFDGTTYRSAGVAFRVPARPPSWQPLEAEGTGLAFRDADAGATIAVSGRCGKDAEDVPLAALTQHLFIQFTEREAVLEELVALDGREALHTVMKAKLDGVPKQFDVWVLKKDGCVYDMVYIARPESFEAGVPGFRAFVGGFATVAGHE